MSTDTLAVMRDTTNTMTREIAHAVYDALVEIGGAREDNRTTFAHDHTTGFHAEDRVVPALGRGGKFRRNTGMRLDGTFGECWYVDGYPEDMNRPRRMIIAALEPLLDDLRRRNEVRQIVAGHEHAVPCTVAHQKPARPETGHETGPEVGPEAASVYNINDPRHGAALGAQPTYMRGLPDPVWHIECWNPLDPDTGKGGHITLDVPVQSRDGAHAHLAFIKKRHQLEGRTYAHYDIVESVYTLTVTTTVHDDRTVTRDAHLPS